MEDALDKMLLQLLVGKVDAQLRLDSSNEHRSQSCTHQRNMYGRKVCSWRSGKHNTNPVPARIR
eukprot:5200502-Pleurochrysis_carterae.AAC.2